jgi:hypothetical protein
MPSSVPSSAPTTSSAPSNQPSASSSGQPVYEVYQNLTTFDATPLNTGSTAVDFYGYGDDVSFSFSGGTPVDNTVLVMLHEDTSDGQLSLVLVVDGFDGSNGEIEVAVTNVGDATLRDDSNDPYSYDPSEKKIEMEFTFAADFTDGLVAPFDLTLGECIAVTLSNSDGIDSLQFVPGPNYDTTGALSFDLEETLLICKKAAP